MPSESKEKVYRLSGPNFQNAAEEASDKVMCRMQKVEKEMRDLRQEVERLKCQRAMTKNAIERAIVRSASILGGHYKLLVPSSARQDSWCCYENSGSCSSNASSDVYVTLPYPEDSDSQSLCVSEKTEAKCLEERMITNTKKKDDYCGQYQLG